MKQRKRWMLAVGVLTLLFIFPAIAGAARGVTSDEITLGFIGDITGPTVVVQKPYLDALKNYFRYVNEQGGINGRKIKLIPEDDRYTTAKAVAAFKKLVTRDKVLAILGPTGSGQMKANYKQIAKEKVPCLGPMSTTDDMLDPFKRYIFTIMSTYQDQVEVILDYIMKELKGQKPRIALFTQKNNPGIIVEKAARAGAKARGTDLVQVTYMQQGSTSASSQVLLLKKAKPNYVMVQGNVGVAVALLKDSKKLGVSFPSIATFSSVSEIVYVKAGNAAKDYKGAHSINAWYDDSPGIKKMREITLKYEPGTADKVRSRYYVQGFVAATVMVEGLKRAGKNLDSEKLVDALESLKGFDTGGLCGPISYSSSSHKGLRAVRIFTSNDYKSGKFVPVTDWLQPK